MDYLNNLGSLHVPFENLFEILLILFAGFSLKTDK